MPIADQHKEKKGLDWSTDQTSEGGGTEQSPGGNRIAQRISGVTFDLSQAIPGKPRRIEPVLKPVRTEAEASAVKGADYKAAASLVLSITGILFLITALAGIALGAFELKRLRGKRSSPRDIKMALAGIIVGSAVLVIDAAATLIILAR